MERVYREQPMVEDVKFTPVVEQVGMKYRGEKGGLGEIDLLPVDTMEGLQVSEWIPEGYYAEPAKVEDTPAQPEEETKEETL